LNSETSGYVERVT